MSLKNAKIPAGAHLSAKVLAAKSGRLLETTLDLLLRYAVAQVETGKTSLDKIERQLEREGAK